MLCFFAVCVIFPNYGNPKFAVDNYFKLSYELDAEWYALTQLRMYLQNKFSTADFRKLICEDINRQNGLWWGGTPVYSLDEAILDLKHRMESCGHLVLQDVPDTTVLGNFVSFFMSQPELFGRYRKLPESEQDGFLLSYLVKYDVNNILYQKYPVLSDLLDAYKTDVSKPKSFWSWFKDWLSGRV